MVTNSSPNPSPNPNPKPNQLLTHVEDQWVQSEGWSRQRKKDEARLHYAIAGQVRRTPGAGAA